MTKYSNEVKTLINSRYSIAKDEHQCVDCQHVFHDTHYYRKFSHLRNCEKQSELTALVIEQVLGSSELATNPDAADTHTLLPKKKSRKISHHGPVPTLGDATSEPISTQYTSEITDALVTFLISAHLPFSVVENHEFKEFLQAIRPAYAAVAPSQEFLESTYRST